jgi:hypothetical protein
MTDKASLITSTDCESRLCSLAAFLQRTQHLLLQTESSEMARAKCQSIYRTLLEARGVAVHQNPAVYIHLLQQTASCDQFHDLSGTRKAFKELVGEDGLERIATFDETPADERRAAHAVTTLYDDTVSALVSALDWPGWVQHHTLDKAERTIARLISGTTVFGGWRSVHPAQSPATPGQVPP